MSTNARDLAHAVLAALAESLEKEGLSSKPKDVERILMEALHERAGSITVIIKTPTGSSGDLKEKVRAVIKEKTGKDAEIIDQKDASLIGGAVISYGDERIDLSVKRSLVDAEMLFTKHS